MKTYFLAAALSLSLVACSSSGSVAPIGATAEIARVDTRIASGETPDVDFYIEARDGFIASMAAFADDQRRKANSPARGIRSAVTGIGFTLSVGGLVASLIVSDEDTRSSPVSAGVGSVTGIIGLIPMGSDSSGAVAALQYLDAEMPRPEQRWASAMDSICVSQWMLFSEDCPPIESVAMDLQSVD